MQNKKGQRDTNIVRDVFTVFVVIIVFWTIMDALGVWKAIGDWFKAHFILFIIIAVVGVILIILSIIFYLKYIGEVSKEYEIKRKKLGQERLNEIYELIGEK